MTDPADTTALTAGDDSSGTAEGLTRREFMTNALVGVAFLGTASGIVDVLIRYLIPPKTTVGGGSGNLEVASLADLPDGSARNFAYSGIPCAVINVGGEVRGYSRVCTHLQCAIDWQTCSKSFLCPCHGAVFDAHGSNVSGPAPKPLRQIKIIVENGKVYAGGWM
jgi:Rieske Fe-S protein